MLFQFKLQGPQAKFDTFHICPIGSHMYRTGQIEVSLEPQRSHGDFDICSDWTLLTATRADLLPGCGFFFAPVLH